MKRADLIVSAAALTAAAGACSVGYAQEPEVLQISTVPIDEGAQVYYAQDLGLFRKYGLDARVQSLVNGNDVVSAIAGGAITIGNSNIMTTAGAKVHGIPIQLIAAAGLWSADIPTSYLLVAESSPVRTAKDLDGKTVAVNNLHSITQLSVEAWIDQNGGHSDTVRFVDMPFPSMNAVLVAGHVAAALVPEPIATFDMRKGHVRILSSPFNAIGTEFAIGGWVARRDYIAGHLSTIRRFNAVMRETAAWANDPKNHHQSAAILLKYTKIRVDGANRERYAKHLIPAQIQPQIDVGAKYGLLSKAFPAVEMFAPPAARE